MRARAEDRLQAGLPMAGLILVQPDVQLGKVIEEEWQGQILFLPL